MLRTELIDRVNSGNLWAFVGSGASADAGLPTWRELVDRVLDQLDASLRARVIGDARFDKAQAREDYAGSLQRVADLGGRESLVTAIRTVIPASGARPGPVLHEIADWPFAGYLTANFDGLLEEALRDRVSGWASVGNSREELRKVSGGAAELVWHIHGSVALRSDRSELVITTDDYERHYLEQSPLYIQLRAFLQQHQVAFVGFGFQDAEFVRLLRLTQKFCTPARPAYAFVADAKEHERVELLEKYNVDVVPYATAGGSHAQLTPLLETHGAFVIRRSLKFNQPARPVPSYDPETTGLMIYNQLVMRHEAQVGTDVVLLMLKARTLAMLAYRSPVSRKTLEAELEDRAADVRATSSGARTTSPDTEVAEVIRALVDESLVVEVERNGDATLALTERGGELARNKSAQAELLGERFSSALRDRAKAHVDDETSIERIASAAEAFLKDCVARRALGVALATGSSGDLQRYHMVGLLQALPEFMEQLSSQAEAQALVKLVRELLAARGGIEHEYLGTALQAQFGVHLLGFDPDALRARLGELSTTAFLIDSMTLIHLLARSSPSCEAANRLISQLRSVGSPTVTTRWFAIEAAEHARWAASHVSERSSINYQTALAASGRAGLRPNAFVEGFLTEVSDGKDADFERYLESVLGHAGGAPSDEDVRESLKRAGIPSPSLSEWEGHGESITAEAAGAEPEIEGRRRRSDTYRHERQVRAEAEALAIIAGLRDGRLKIDGATYRGAYFVSPSRLIDDVSRATARVTMRPQALLQWLGTLAPCEPEELGVLIDALVAELTERGVSIVDSRHLQTVFSPLASGARDRLDDELVRHHNLLAERWGTGAEHAFAELDAVDTVIALEGYYAQKAGALEMQLANEKSARREAAARAKITDKEKQELALLKAREHQRRLRMRSKQRGRRRK